MGCYLLRWPSAFWEAERRCLRFLSKRFVITAVAVAEAATAPVLLAGASGSADNYPFTLLSPGPANFYEYPGSGNPVKTATTVDSDDFYTTTTNAHSTPTSAFLTPMGDASLPIPPASTTLPMWEPSQNMQQERLLLTYPSPSQMQQSHFLQEQQQQLEQEEEEQQQQQQKQLKQLKQLKQQQFAAAEDDKLFGEQQQSSTTTTVAFEAAAVSPKELSSTRNNPLRGTTMLVLGLVLLFICGLQAPASSPKRTTRGEKLGMLLMLLGLLRMVHSAVTMRPEARIVLHDYYLRNGEGKQHRIEFKTDIKKQQNKQSFFSSLLTFLLTLSLSVPLVAAMSMMLIVISGIAAVFAAGFAAGFVLSMIGAVATGAVLLLVNLFLRLVE